MITVQATITRQMAHWIINDEDRTEVVRFFRDQKPNPYYFLSGIEIKDISVKMQCNIVYKPSCELLHIEKEAYTDLHTKICEFAAEQCDRYGEDCPYSFDETEIYYEGETYTLGLSGYVYYNERYDSMEICIHGFTCTGETGNDIKCDFNRRAL